MNSLLKSKPKSAVGKFVALMMLCCLCVLGLQYTFPYFLRTTMYVAAKPLWYVRDATYASVSDFWGYFEGIDALQEQNNLLRQDLEALRVKEMEFAQMKVLYEDMRGLSTASSSVSKTVARILSKPPFTPYDSFVVDAGTISGVEVGDLVYAHNALAIGRISHVAESMSTVTLFSSGGEVQEFEVLRTGTSIEVYGKGGGNFELSVPKDFDIVEGDVLQESSSGLSAVATVYNVDKTSQNSFKKVYARVPWSVFQSRFVLIGDL